MASLKLLHDIRKAANKKIPLAWTPGQPNDAAAIEVYPAATLVSHGLRSSGYKKREHEPERRAMLQSLKREIVFGNARHEELVIKKADTLDAVVCILAGLDFLTGHVLLPPANEPFRKEGWIWARPRDASLGEE